MNKIAHHEKRVLAIDPTVRGFGFAVLEGPNALVAWGVLQVMGSKIAESLAQIASLIDQYQPELLVIEDYLAGSFRRRQRVRRLLPEIEVLAVDAGIKARSVAWSFVQESFSETGHVTKHQIAIAIAHRFPELDPRLPPIRKPWMSQDDRMSIFGAVALGAASY
ncbi:MAG: hypothetical protein HY650_10830 [Acidobacteria bacterium]|nr:hypothetical protein [Acidobacteriota bacterium]